MTPDETKNKIALSRKDLLKVKMTAARPDTWMPWHIAKYLADTMHLTTEQHGAYLLLLAAGWMRGGELSDDNGQLAAIARLPLKRWLAMRDTISAFYTISAGAWRQKRQIEELEKAIALTNARSEAGKRGGRPKANDKQTESPALANGLANEEQGQTPITLTVTSKKDSDADASAAAPPEPHASPIDLKRELWRQGKAFLGQHGIPASQAGSLLGGWRKDFGDAVVIDVLARADAECVSGDVVAYIVGCLKRRSENGQQKPNGYPGQTSRVAKLFEQLGPDADEDTYRSSVRL